MSDLLVTTHTPVLRSGQTMRTYGVSRALAASGGLTLLYARFEGEEPDQAFRSIPGIELREVVGSRGPRRLAAYGGARLRGIPSGFARGISPDLAREAARLAAAPGRGRVIADGPIAAAALSGLAGRRAVIYNAHNLESGFRGELSDGAGSIAALRRFERGLLARAAESWLVSEADIAAAAELCPGARLRYVPNVVDVAAIEPISPLPAEPRAVFVANFSYEPNRNGARFLLERVMPRVWEELPEARLMLAGAGLELPAEADGRIEAAGFVDDLDAAYGRSRCALVPLLQGGGTPLKFVEALAYGLPVLATPRAAAGLAVTDGVDCLLAGDERDFASALVGLLRSDASEIGRAGRRLAQQRYSIEALTRLLAC
ncbi:MAG: glycosyltransferase family 4 protein [Solirubrobacteraceae bacterium]